MKPEPHPAVAARLTKPQQRLLIATAATPDSSKRGRLAKGSQWPPIRRLRELGLLYVDEYHYIFDSDRIHLRPTEKGREWAAVLSARAAPCGTRPKGQDGEAGLVRSTSDAVTPKAAGAQTELEP